VSPKLKGSSCLVTGGAGFIGSRLVRHLLSIGVSRVTVLDSFSTGSEANLVEDPRVTVVRYTLGAGPSADLVPILSASPFVFHLAAEKHSQSENNADRLFRTNVNGMYQLLEAAAANQVQRVVFTSSLYAYGRTSGEGMVESEPLNPWTVYGTTKAAGESLCEHFFRSKGLSYNILRSFFVYGPGQTSGTGYKTVIPVNFGRIRKGEPPKIHGDGQQILDYVFIDDVVEATVLVMEKAPSRAIYNVGSGEGTSVEDLTREMTRAAGVEFRPEYGPADWTSGTRRVADVSKIRDEIGWRASTTLAAGLDRTYRWLRESSA
jgi:UDP-glucose 4-epimerase